MLLKGDCLSAKLYARAVRNVKNTSFGFSFPSTQFVSPNRRASLDIGNHDWIKGLDSGRATGKPEVNVNCCKQAISLTTRITGEIIP